MTTSYRLKGLLQAGPEAWQEDVVSRSLFSGNIGYSRNLRRSPSIRNLLVYDLGVSDHSIISMDDSCPSHLPKPKRDIHFRNIKNINPAILYSDLKLLASVNHPSVNKSVEHYNYSLHCLLDTHAPLKTRTVSLS